jgi:CRISPR/Cas system CSM-associated protein Csm2 small subunit
MDVEKTIQFILQSQAQMEANVGRHEELIAALTKAQERTETTVNKVSASILDLTEVMRRSKIEMDERFRETNEMIRELAEDRDQTRENVNALVRTVDGLIRRDGAQ